MSGGKSATHEAAVLNTGRGTSLTAWTPYLAYFTVAPTDAGGGTEVTGGGYARQAITLGAPTGGGPSQSANTAEIITTMPAGTPVAAAVMDALTGGTIRYFVGGLSTSYAAGDQARVPVGSLTIQEE